MDVASWSPGDQPGSPAITPCWPAPSSYACSVSGTAFAQVGWNVLSRTQDHAMALSACIPTTSHPAPSESDLLARLEHPIDHAAHLLPAQGPINVFIHHNTLHAFED